MGPSEKAGQHAIRRSTRLPLEIPVQVTSLSAANPFSEQCNTTLVNAHGCGLISTRAITRGIQVRIEIVSAKRHTTAQVAEVVPLGGDPETWLVGLELDIPGNFWGIEYAPSDWAIEETLEPAAPPHVDPEPAKPANPRRRWRLTDISVGACYLESANAFPVDTPVLVSIRSLDKEYLLDGVVRVSHPQTGMGIQFTGVPDLRERVEELIGHLTSNREVPRIFVGRKEGQAAAPAFAAVPRSDPDAPDPLLDLVLEGASMGAEQFLGGLRAERLGKRRDPRVDIALPVLLTGVDVNGRPLHQRVMTVNISRHGALLEGIHGSVKADDKIFLGREHKKEEFRVVSVMEDDALARDRISVAAVDPNTSFWDSVLESVGEFGAETETLRGERAGN
jgi:hypothetical protein